MFLGKHKLLCQQNLSCQSQGALSILRELNIPLQQLGLRQAKVFLHQPEHYQMEC